MHYSISETSKNHLKVHFGEWEKSGSKFNLDVFPNLNSLLSSLITITPARIIKQSNNREAHEYCFPEPHFTGFNGVGLRKDFPNAVIQTEIRNGFETEFIEVDSLTKTCFVTVIAELKDAEYSIITVYPGRYAPAFPYTGMVKEEQLIAEKFWKQHILLRLSMANLSRKQ
ncbi:MAG: hypothetical protein EBV15_07050 [Bacteroidetes bacterium]|jgi:hypothetical protein|nr:hypothetical protein [Bacteroidota bacterium]